MSKYFENIVKSLFNEFLFKDIFLELCKFQTNVSI